MKMYYPGALEYICYLKNLYCFNYFEDEHILHQKWLEKIDEMFYKKVSIKLYRVYHNHVRLKYFPPSGIESDLFGGLIDDCYELANDVADLEMIQEKLKYFNQDLYRL